MRIKRGALPCGCRVLKRFDYAGLISGTPRNPYMCSCRTYKYWTTVDGLPRFREIEDGVVSLPRVSK